MRVMDSGESQRRILVVDDHEVTRKLLKEVLESEKFQVVLSASGEEALGQIKKENFGVILSDIRMAEVGGFDLLREIKRITSDTLVILMTGFGSMEGAITAVHEGAFDYISKPFKMDELKTIVGRAFKQYELMKLEKVTPWLKKMEINSRGLIGKSPQMLEVYKMLARAALSSSTILLIGESGTGKELVARAIHDNSARTKKKFVAVNCGSLAENLLESELFGHVKGAFTSAIHEKRGLFEEAHGGTLFLDEIGDVSPALQIKLLRVLQESEIRMVGSVDSRKVDVRIIAATHRDLDGLVKSSRFRDDLYYRLKVISIHLPALKNRIEDLPELVGFFLMKYAEKSKKSISHISDSAMQLLKEYSWPGNVRELEHAIERAVALTNATVLFPEDFPDELLKKEAVISVNSPEGFETTSASSLEEMEKIHILRVLQEVQYNKSRASEVLGIDRATLYRKAQKYGIDLRGKYT